MQTYFFICNNADTVMILRILEHGYRTVSLTYILRTDSNLILHENILFILFNTFCNCIALLRSDCSLLERLASPYKAPNFTAWAVNLNYEFSKVLLCGNSPGMDQLICVQLRTY